MEKTVITSFKGFDSNLTCRSHQFEIGKTYAVEGAIKVCENGFHACENPLDVLCYYPLIDDDCNLSRFAIVEQGGEISKLVGDTKIASAEITIKAELTLPAFIKEAIKWMMEVDNDSNYAQQASSGNYAQQASSGDNAQQASSGNYAQQASSGNYAQQASSGNYAQQASSGYNAKQASSGNHAQQASSGDYAQQASSGNYAKQASSGYNAKQASSGNHAQQASSGNHAQQASSGNYAKQASSGNYAKQASSGDNAQQASSGYNAKQASSGNYAKHRATGANSVIVSSGIGAKASGVNGTQISLAEYADGVCVGFATGCIGKDGLKPDTWYQAKGGKLVEVTS